MNLQDRWIFDFQNMGQTVIFLCLGGLGHRRIFHKEIENTKLI